MRLQQHQEEKLVKFLETNLIFSVFCLPLSELQSSVAILYTSLP